MTTDGGGWTLIGQFNHPAAAVTLTQRADFPNKGSDTPTANETSGTGIFGVWRLANATIRSAMPMTEYRVESYSASTGFHFKSTDVSFIKNNTIEIASGKTNLGKPSYWPAATVYYNSCSTTIGYRLIEASMIIFSHSGANCQGTGNYLISRVHSSNVNFTNEGRSTTTAGINGLGRLWVR